MFEGLPVLLVDSFSDLSVEFLNRKWEEMICSAEKYDWKRLTVTYWQDMIATVIRTADNALVQRNHPIKGTTMGERCFSCRADWLETKGIDNVGTLS